MTSENSAQDSEIVLHRELTMFEYGRCPDRDQASILYEQRERLQPYIQKGYLTLGFEDGQPCVRAAGHVGVLPFSVEGKPHLLLIAPKGCQHKWDRGLLRFLELLAFDERETSPECEIGWDGQAGRHPFLLFLAIHYARLLKDLCRRDFRSYYRAEENELRGRIRGRLHLSHYARIAVQGKPHILPCRWDEFTVDNWDNRILLGAARRLKDVAATLDPKAAQSIWAPFRPLLPWFGSVSEVPITTTEFRHSRLGRTSAYYRRALVWARLLLQGSNLPGAGGQVPPLVLDAAVAFEKFAEIVTQAAKPDGWKFGRQVNQEFFIKQEGRTAGERHRKLDILLSSPDGRCAVGETKYKDVLGRAVNDELRSVNDIVRICIQPSDWNQLYVYMRMIGALRGFFVVPFWEIDGASFEWIDDFQFTVPPCDGTVRVAVLGLNLLTPLKEVKQAASEKLRDWLSRMV